MLMRRRREQSPGASLEDLGSALARGVGAVAAGS